MKSKNKDEREEIKSMFLSLVKTGKRKTGNGKNGKNNQAKKNQKTKIIYTLKAKIT